MSDHNTPVAHGQVVEKDSMRGTFMWVFFWLTFLTVIELFVPPVYSAEWNSTTKMLLLCLLAGGKALLVACYFMHLKWETKWTRYVALMPIYMGVFVIIIMLETVYR